MIEAVIGTINGRPRYRRLSAAEQARLIELLTHRKSRLRWMAADLLGKYRFRAAVLPLQDRLSDPQWLVRLHAAKALGRIEDVQSLPVLAAALVDPHPWVRRAILHALYRFQNPQMVPLVIRALREDPSLQAGVIELFTSIMNADAARQLTETVMQQRVAPTQPITWMNELWTALLVRLLTPETTMPWQPWIMQHLRLVGTYRAVASLNMVQTNTKSPYQMLAHRTITAIQYRHYATVVAAIHTP